MTIVEMALVTGLVGVFGGIAILMANTSAQTYRTESSTADLVQASRRTFSQIEDRLRLADSGGVRPQGTIAPLWTSLVRFQPNEGWNGAAANFGNFEEIRLENDPQDPADGLDNDGDGLVDEGQVVWIDDEGLATQKRTVLCRRVASTLEGEIPGNLVDDNGNGLDDEPGFAVTFDGSRAIVRLTLQRVNVQGDIIDHTFERTIVLRNTGAQFPNP